MAVIDEAMRALVGRWSEPVPACDAVEPGGVRRFAQAILDDDPDYDPDGPGAARYGGPVAPPLYPNHLLRRPYGSPDLVQAHAGDPDFDGVVPGPGLPPLPGLQALPVLNAGASYEFLRLARQGERVLVRQRYADLHEKPGARGTLVFVVIESELCTCGGEVLLRATRTLIRRAP